jgi:hypothetical protein
MVRLCPRGRFAIVIRGQRSGAAKVVARTWNVARRRRGELTARPLVPRNGERCPRPAPRLRHRPGLPARRAIFDEPIRWPCGTAIGRGRRRRPRPLSGEGRWRGCGSVGITARSCCRGKRFGSELATPAICPSYSRPTFREAQVGRPCWNVGRRRRGIERPEGLRGGTGQRFPLSPVGRRLAVRSVQRYGRHRTRRYSTETRTTTSVPSSTVHRSRRSGFSRTAGSPPAPRTPSAVSPAEATAAWSASKPTTLPAAT